MGNKAKHGLLLLLAVAACSNPEPPTAPAFSVSGKLQDPKILEASGLARSHRQANLLWIINDDGAIAHAVDHAGARSGEFKLKNSRNRDWEDLASLTLHDKPYLMIADIGDNTAQRKHLSLYFVAEPDADNKNVAEVAWRVRYRYAHRPRDAAPAPTAGRTRGPHGGAAEQRGVGGARRSDPMADRRDPGRSWWMG